MNESRGHVIESNWFLPNSAYVWLFMIYPEVSHTKLMRIKLSNRGWPFLRKKIEIRDRTTSKFIEKTLG